MIKKFILNRLGEASTYRGLLAIAGIFGVSFAPEKADAIVGLCVALYATLAVFFPDKFGRKSVDPPAAPPTVLTQAELSKPQPVYVGNATTGEAKEVGSLGDGEIQPQPKWDGTIPGSFRQ